MLRNIDKVERLDTYANHVLLEVSKHVGNTFESEHGHHRPQVTHLIEQK